MIPYKKEDGSIEENIPEFIVPRKIRLMSTYISKILKENPHNTSIELDITPSYLKIIIEYC